MPQQYRLRIRNNPALVGIWLLFCLFSQNASATTALDALGLAMDPDTDPCTDFYRYACGGWLDSTDLEADQINFTRGFGLANQAVNNHLLILFEAAASLYPSGDVDQDRVGAFYQSCKAAKALPPTDLSGLDPYMALIDNVSNRAQFMQVAGQLHKIGVNRLFNINVIPNFINAQTYTILLTAGDPGFPDGDIYTRVDPTSKALRKAGVSYIKDILMRLGETPTLAQRHTSQIMMIEKVLSKHHEQYGKSKGLAYLSAPYVLNYISPKIPWENFFVGIDAAANQGLFVSPAFIRELGQILHKMPVDTLKAYLRWSLISSFRNYLPNEYYRNIHTEVVFKNTRSSISEVCVYQTSRELGDAAAKLLAGNETSPAVSTMARAIMTNIKHGFKQNLPQVHWLNSDAMAATQSKLDALTEQYSYPDVWPNYAGLVFDPQDLLGNVITARSENFHRLLMLYGEAVDRNGWEFLSSPQTVNAFYYNLKNQIHFLAGLLRPPFLDVDAPAVLNYGGAGTVAAHELMHGFNLSGRYFQADGHYSPLWTKKVNSAFTKRSQCVSNQYSRFPVAPKLKVNGKITLEENLADVNGLKLAYQSFQNVADGPADFMVNAKTLSKEQVFFIRYAQNYCSLSRPGVEEYLSSRSWWRYAPDRYRAIGPIINRPEFAQAFNCPQGAAMNPIKKCTIW